MDHGEKAIDMDRATDEEKNVAAMPEREVKKLMRRRTVDGQVNEHSTFLVQFLFINSSNNSFHLKQVQFLCRYHECGPEHDRWMNLEDCSGTLIDLFHKRTKIQFKKELDAKIRGIKGSLRQVDEILSSLTQNLLLARAQPSVSSPPAKPSNGTH